MNFQNATYYAIILDCTTDESRKEQIMTIVVRFVEAVAGKEVVVRELEFVQELEITGEGLSGCLLD